MFLHCMHIFYNKRILNTFQSTRYDWKGVNYVDIVWKLQLPKSILLLLPPIPIFIRCTNILSLPIIFLCFSFFLHGSQIDFVLFIKHATNVLSYSQGNRVCHLYTNRTFIQKYCKAILIYISYVLRLRPISQNLAIIVKGLLICTYNMIYLRIWLFLRHLILRIRIVMRSTSILPKAFDRADWL